MTADAGGTRDGGREAAEAVFEIVNERGMHARAATKLVQLAGRYRCDVLLSSDEAEGVNAKSVMGVLLLCGAKGTMLHVRADGPAAGECVDAIGVLIANRFGEPE
ncbi:MAG: HPr family phosphocarrier protein [Polyangiaceae bacterium]